MGGFDTKIFSSNLLDSSNQIRLKYAGIIIVIPVHVM